MFAVRLANGTIKVYKQFAEFKAFKTQNVNDGIFGGKLLGVRSKDCITFYDWINFCVVRRIDLASNLKTVKWSEDGSKVILAMEEAFYLLTFNEKFVMEKIMSDDINEEELEDGFEEAFDFNDEYAETVNSGLWVSADCFTFTNARGNISYLIGGKVMKLGNADRKQHILGYDGKQNRLYLVDKSLNIYTHRLLLSVLNFQEQVLNGNLDKAKSMVTSIPVSFHSKLAKFLEQNGQKEMAFQLTPDLDHKFELAIQLNQVDEARNIAERQESQEKWRKVGDIALKSGQFELVEECYTRSQDYNSLLLFYSSYGD